MQILKGNFGLLFDHYCCCRPVQETDSPSSERGDHELESNAVGWRVYDDLQRLDSSGELVEPELEDIIEESWKKSARKWFCFDSVLNPHSSAVRVSRPSIRSFVDVDHLICYPVCISFDRRCEPKPSSSSLSTQKPIQELLDSGFTSSNRLAPALR